MAFSMAGGGPSGPQINVTPLIDVLLTLIIMFMLVVSMDKSARRKGADSTAGSKGCNGRTSAAHDGDPGRVDGEGYSHPR